jgi:putative ABC transport system permease protein
MKAFRLVLRALVTGPASRRPVRALLPVLGVAVGVAAIAAIQHANRSVTESFRESARAVSGRSDFTVVGAAGVPLEAMKPLAFLWRVGAFTPLVTGSAVIGDGSGEVVTVLGTDYDTGGGVREMRLAAPAAGSNRMAVTAPDTVLVPVPLAKRRSLAVGSRVPLVSGGVRTDVTVGGLLELTGLARAAGGDVVVTDLFTAGRLLGKEGRADRVDVVLDPGVSRETARREIAKRLPAGLRVETAGRQALAAERMARAFRFNLNALASLTLIVGAFLVANAVSISVLRRRPEIATLAALGTSRGTVFAAFVVEGLAVGAVGILLGVAGGYALADAALSVVAGTVGDVYAPNARISAAGFGRPALLAAGIGAAASIVAALVPAREAARVAPSPAMRPGSAEAVRRFHLAPRAAAAGTAVVLALALATAPPLFGFPWAGFAAVGLVVAALAFAGPLLVRTGARATRRPLSRLFGPAGRLASGFFGGSLARHGLAVTALAMALGMTLAMITTVASMRETVRAWVGATLSADLWVKAESGASGGMVGELPPEIVLFLESLPGVGAVDPFRIREGSDARGRTFALAASDFRVLARAGGSPLLDGRDPAAVASEARASGHLLVSEPFARRFRTRRGERVALSTPRGIRELEIAGIYRDFSNDRGTVLMDRALYVPLFGDVRITSLGLVARSGVSPEALRRTVLSRSRGRWRLDVTTTSDLRREVLSIFDRTFAVTRALEAIAVVVAVLGIANALAAAAVERRRSFGLLRTVGATRRQIRGAVLLEGFLVGLVATVAAVVAAGAFAMLLIGVINPQSFGWSVVPSVPVGRLAAAAGLVLAASLAAGIVPGRIAASADPASALAEE